MSRSTEQFLECQDVVSASEQRSALPLLRQGFVAVPNNVLVAAAAGVKYGDVFSTEVSHRAIVRHAVLVRDGWCSLTIWAGDVRVEQRALNARNV